jgi:hypothetical protein
MRKISITLTESIHTQLYHHLFPGDGKEAVALCLCGKAETDDHLRLIMNKILLIPHEHCVRTSSMIKWSTELLTTFLTEAEKKNLSICKIHSHPSNYISFSSIDDHADNEMFDIKTAWLSEASYFASLVMLPDKSMFGRIVEDRGNFTAVDHFRFVGDNITFDFKADNDSKGISGWDKKNAQTLGAVTVKLFKKLKVGVVGCSGTGSPVIEQLIRLGIGKIVLVDPDVVEHKNLNRILNTTKDDADSQTFKVDVFKRLSDELGLVDLVIPINKNLYDSENGLKELSTCDVLFGCVDSIDGRHLLNLLATYYCIPFFDLGVKLIADGNGGIEKICGTVNYIKPGGSSLLSRGVYTIDDIAAASLLRSNPPEYKKLASEKYIKNVSVESPAVISVNMNVASVAINEFLCRVHKIRNESMADFATTRLCISDGYVQYESEGKPDPYFTKQLGMGDQTPLLNLPELSFIQNETVQFFE